MSTVPSSHTVCRQTLFCFIFPSTSTSTQQISSQWAANCKPTSMVSFFLFSLKARSIESGVDTVREFNLGRRLMWSKPGFRSRGETTALFYSFRLLHFKNLSEHFASLGVCVKGEEQNQRNVNKYKQADRNWLVNRQTDNHSSRYWYVLSFKESTVTPANSNRLVFCYTLRLRKRSIHCYWV